MSQSGCQLSADLTSLPQTAAGGPFGPEGPEELRASLTGYLLERTLHEIGYELDQRPEWVTIPLGELLELVQRK